MSLRLKVDLHLTNGEQKPMNGILAKIFGWLQFASSVGSQVGQGAPHGWAQWLYLIGSLAAAVGIHAASNVGQLLPVGATASTAVSVSPSATVKQ
jgi:hypothetical protein